MAIINITTEFLATLVGADGIHRRLLAGLESSAGCASGPSLRSVAVGGQPENRFYTDYDCILQVGIGGGSCDGSRSSAGILQWPVHVSGGGRVTLDGMYSDPHIDFEVWSRSIPDESTRFIGSFKREKPELVGRLYTADNQEIMNGSAYLYDRHVSQPVLTGPTTVGHEISRLCRKIVARAGLEMMVRGCEPKQG